MSVRDAILRRPLFYAAVVFAGLIFISQPFLKSAPPFPISGGPVFLGGVVVSPVEERQARYGGRKVSFVMRAQRIWDGPGSAKAVTGKVKVTLTTPRNPFHYGDLVVIEGELAAPKSARNPGGFDQRAYLERMGVRALFFAGKKSKFKILARHQGNFIQEKALALKKFLSRSLSENFEKDDASFLKALFLGERSDFDQEFKDLFIKTGTLHILAVSGFNIGFLILSLVFILRPLRLAGDLKLALALVFVWLYCLVVGWQAPVVRASVMATVFILGRILGRKADVLNALGLAALIILAANPLQLFDVGFQLSFLAVFGLAVFLGRFIEKPKLFPHELPTPGEKFRWYFQELFWVSFVCLAVTLPVTAQNFYIVTPLSLLANLAVVPISFLLFFLGLLFFATFWWVPKFLFFIPLAMKLLMKFFTAALFVVENIPGAYFVVGKLDVVFLGLLGAGIFYFLWDPRLRSRVSRAGVIVLFCANVILAQGIVRQMNRHFSMTALDVGQGDAIYFEFPNGSNMLIDAGKGGEADKGRWVVAPFLKSKGVHTLDAAVVSHPQEDHIGGLPTVFGEFKVRHVIHSRTPYPTHLYRVLKEKIAQEGAREFFVREGDEIRGIPDVGIQVFNPPLVEKDKNINNDSVVLKIIYGNTSFLLTGDIEGPAMAGILQSGAEVRSTVLKIPHHGSKLKEDGRRFVEAVAPAVSVISAGERNPFGHPSPKTLAVLESVPGNRILRTDRDGAVEVRSDSARVRVVV